MSFSGSTSQGDLSSVIVIIRTACAQVRGAFWSAPVFILYDFGWQPDESITPLWTLTVAPIRISPKICPSRVICFITKTLLDAESITTEFTLFCSLSRGYFHCRILLTSGKNFSVLTIFIEIKIIGTGLTLYHIFCKKYLYLLEVKNYPLNGNKSRNTQISSPEVENKN